MRERLTQMAAGPPNCDGSFAHSVRDLPISAWHRLEDHLFAVGRGARNVCGRFGAGDLGELIGRWHDLGKYAGDFQAYLRAGPDARGEAMPGRVDHSSAGAILARQRLARNPGLVAAFAIAGHHAGLADFQDLNDRLARNAARLDAAHAGGIDPAVLAVPPTTLPAWVQEGWEPGEFIVRVLFSALIDADRTDTEAFCDPKRAAARAGRRPALADLRDRLAVAQQRLGAAAPPTVVNAVRAAILADCIDAASGPPGIFALPAPTGAGKTLAAMRFALEHAVHHQLDRIVVAIPYTSIIEQTAAVYRTIFGRDAVIEHHSAIEPAVDTDANRRACENWDAPIIVTTNVQLFETMFTHRASRARKLHALVRSVIVLDEAQTIPVEFLEPILGGLREMVEHYGSSLVVATATQPALAARLNLPVAEIVREPAQHFAALDRVDIRLPASLYEPTANAQLAELLQAEHQGLVITHLRADARDLAERLADAIHLSASMCAAHRTVVLRRVRALLAAGQPCRVVATQLMEAGVDVDFPSVRRVLGPLDAMAQAIGRCNREGRLRDAKENPCRGRFEVFVAESKPPQGQRIAVSVTRTMLELYGARALSDPAIFPDYFQRLYANAQTDAKQIQRDRKSLKYRTVGERFEIIAGGRTMPIVVPYAGAEAAVERLRRALAAGCGERDALRGLQRYVVTVPLHVHARLVKVGDLERVGDAIDVLRPEAARARYDDRLGLVYEISATTENAADAAGEE